MSTFEFALAILTMILAFLAFALAVLAILLGSKKTKTEVRKLCQNIIKNW